MQTGACLQTLSVHSDHVTSLAWLPDNSGFISGGLDREIILWVRSHQSPHYRYLSHITTGLGRSQERYVGYYADPGDRPHHHAGLHAPDRHRDVRRAARGAERDTGRRDAATWDAAGGRAAVGDEDHHLRPRDEAGGDVRAPGSCCARAVADGFAGRSTWTGSSRA